PSRVRSALKDLRVRGMMEKSRDVKRSEDRPATARSPGGEGGTSVEPGGERREVWRSGGPPCRPPSTHRVHGSPGGRLVANHLARRDPSGHGQLPLTGDRFEANPARLRVV